MRAEQAQAAGQFYSEDEYDLGPLRASDRRLLELGRSCLHRDYRGGTAMMHLWNGLAHYIAAHGIEVMFGVASFHGTDPARIAGPLSLLHHRHLAPPDVRPEARAAGFMPMDLIAEGDARPQGRDPRHARADQGLSAAGRFRGPWGLHRPALQLHRRLPRDGCRAHVPAAQGDLHPRYRGLGGRRVSLTWKGPPPPAPPELGLAGWLRVLRRGAGIIAALLICFPLLLLLRLPERAIWGQARPVTPWITQGVCVWACWCMGLGRDVSGVPMRGEGAYVANHSSWLDILVLNASKRMYFVAKAEVAGWGGIGWLARGTGTVFVRRDRTEAARQAAMFERRLHAGHRLLFFPEGTSTDGLRVLPFRPTLFRRVLLRRPAGHAAGPARERGLPRAGRAGGGLLWLVGQYCVRAPACCPCWGARTGARTGDLP
jgi:1-acyl-sn-glycerol-3-phosphate acyltransferase